MTHPFLRLSQNLLLASTLLLAACGGGSGAGGGGDGPAGTETTGRYSGPGTTTAAEGGDAGNASGGSDGATGVAGGAGTGGTGADSGSDGTGVAGGVGSGGTGADSGTDGTGVAGGVGSGGTGVSGDGSGTGDASAAVGIGSVDGFGSIIVNETRWQIDRANVFIADDAELKLGMSVRVAGRMSADLSRGTATSVVTAAELRGPVANADAASGRFEVMGIQVSTDENTLYEGLGTPGRLGNGTVVQVYGLPVGSGQLRATRIQRRDGSPDPIVTGAISQLNAAGRSFKLGNLTVSYAGASFSAGLAQTALANGQVVRVRAAQGPRGGTLEAASVQSWYAVGAPVSGARLSLAGLVTDFVSQADFKVQGVRVSGARTNVSGGPARALINGARVEVSGTVANGVLVLDKLRLRGGAEGAPISYSVSGKISQFESLARFKVHGQWIDASGPGLVVSGGTAAQVARGRTVKVTGGKMAGDALIAETLSLMD